MGQSSEERFYLKYVLLWTRRFPPSPPLFSVPATRLARGGHGDGAEGGDIVTQVTMGWTLGSVCVAKGAAGLGGAESCPALVEGGRKGQLPWTD